MTEERNPIVEAVLTDGVLTHLVTEDNDHKMIKSGLSIPYGVGGVGDALRFHHMYDPAAETFFVDCNVGLVEGRQRGTSITLDEAGEPFLQEDGLYSLSMGVTWNDPDTGTYRFIRMVDDESPDWSKGQTLPPFTGLRMSISDTLWLAGQNRVRFQLGHNAPTDCVATVDIGIVRLA